MPKVLEMRRTVVRGADGKPINPIEHRVRFGGQVAIEKADFPPPKAKIRGTFEADTGGFLLDQQKKGWIEVIKLNVTELSIESIEERPDDQPELFDGNGQPTGEGEE
jgi:hypothetical protein